jgi:flavodoxin
VEKIQIIYASTSGNTELVVEYISERIQSTSDLEFELHRAEFTDIEVILKNKYFILATSTWEHGVVNPFFNNLIKEIQKHNMQGKYAGFVGCGNGHYERILFCKGIDIVKDVFIAQGGSELGHVLKIDGDPHIHLELQVKHWADGFRENIDNLASNR